MILAVTLTSLHNTPSRECSLGILHLTPREQSLSILELVDLLFAVGWEKHYPGERVFLFQFFIILLQPKCSFHLQLVIRELFTICAQIGRPPIRASSLKHLTLAILLPHL